MPVSWFREIERLCVEIKRVELDSNLNLKVVGILFWLYWSHGRSLAVTTSMKNKSENNVVTGKRNFFQ